MGISFSTARNIVTKWKEKVSVKAKNMSGRRKKLTERHLRSLLKTVTAKDLQEHLAGMEMHRTTVQRTVQKNGLHGRIMRRKPFLRPQQKTNLLKYTQKTC